MIKQCGHCGKEISNNRKAILYCSRLCGRNAGKKRSRLRKNPLIEIKCVVCGNSVERSEKIRGGQKPKTCGSFECVEARKRQCKINHKINNPDMYQRYKETKKIKEKAKIKKHKKKPITKAQIINFKKRLAATIKEVKRRILRRDKQRICGKCKRLVAISEWNNTLFSCNKCARIYYKEYQSSEKGKNAYKKAYAKERSTPDLLCKARIRGRVSKAMRMYARGINLKGSKVRYLGCTYKQAFEYLASQFKHGMTWRNFGKHWHIDHVFPLASFDLTNEAQRHKAFHYTNLQPLEAKKNIIKSDTVPNEHQPMLMYV